MKISLVLVLFIFSYKITISQDTLSVSFSNYNEIELRSTNEVELKLVLGEPYRTWDYSTTAKFMNGGSRTSYFRYMCYDSLAKDDSLEMIKQFNQAVSFYANNSICRYATNKGSMLLNIDSNQKVSYVNVTTRNHYMKIEGCDDD